MKVKSNDMNDSLIGKTVVFLPGNKVEYYQDFKYRKGVPANIEFQVYDKRIDNSYRLMAYGYGIFGVDPKSYGDGKIYVAEKDIISNLNNKVQPEQPKPEPKRYTRKGKLGIEIYVKDPELGYTAFFGEFPKVISEGKTIKEAQMNLWNAIYDLMKHHIK